MVQSRNDNLVGGAKLGANAVHERKGEARHVVAEDNLVGVSTPPLFMRHSYWPRAIPQYTLGYGRFLEIIDRLENSAAGLYVGGNVRNGISLQDRIKSGEKLAARVTEK